MKTQEYVTGRHVADALDYARSLEATLRVLNEGHSTVALLGRLQETRATVRWLEQWQRQAETP